MISTWLQRHWRQKRRADDGKYDALSTALMGGMSFLPEMYETDIGGGITAETRHRALVRAAMGGGSYDKSSYTTLGYDRPLEDFSLADAEVAGVLNQLRALGFTVENAEGVAALLGFHTNTGTGTGTGTGTDGGENVAGEPNHHFHPDTSGFFGSPAAWEWNPATQLYSRSSDGKTITASDYNAWRALWGRSR